MKLKKRLQRESGWLKEEYGIITPAIMVIFRFLQFLPPQIFIGNRTDHYYKDLLGKTQDEKKKIVNRRAKIIDLIIISFLTLEIVVPLLIDRNVIIFEIVKYSFLFLLFFRLIDILQVTVNTILFDGLRFIQNRASKYSRIIILLVLNYIELILIFGYVYFLFNSSLENYKSILDAYYFSSITLVTVGYGDLHPTQLLKVISGIQGVIGTLFLALIIAKVVSLIPNVGNIDDKRIDENKSDENKTSVQ